ncbi:uncharacterized protein N7482_010370 [Penicillium canariense]|uniref:Uncharacterized protein n=1 Tax=Penicillium canariense TaxID=189055 RepID=A0A9W9LE95_9EURO|nr:uncharacterized protein N7482_010370 [Penicillium canariense]KAJ5151118.1 hypothetical protein N7482_010370 [Penicillium canariense]
MSSTYLQNHALSCEIELVRNEPNIPWNAVILGVWNSILSLIFPVQEGYLITPREHGWFNEREFWYDLQVRHITDHKRQPFLVVICRTAPEPSDLTAGLARWTDHLELYMDSIFGKRRRPGRAGRVFGIIANVRNATFFSYDIGDDIPLLIFREHDIEDLPAFHLVQDHERIQNLLTTIRRQHH